MYYTVFPSSRGGRACDRRGNPIDGRRSAQCNLPYLDETPGERGRGRGSDGCLLDLVGAGGGPGRRRAHDRDVLPARGRRRLRRGGVAAWLGASVPVQLLIGGALGRRAHDGRAPLADRAGRCPRRHRWTSGIPCTCWTWKDDGTARVNYRGTQWDAELAAPGETRAETHVHRRHPWLDAADRGSPRVAQGAAYARCLQLSTECTPCGTVPPSSRSRFSSSALIVVIKTIRVVPQQHALVVERLGRFFAVLQPGLNFVIPFVDRVAYRHDLREIPFDVPSQICITKDNTQLQVDGILYFQVTDREARVVRLAAISVLAITQLAQTTLRSVIGRMELDRTFEERDHINGRSCRALDQAAANWGVKVLRYEIKDLTPPEEILHVDAGADHRRAREARGDRDVGRQAAGADQPRQRRARGGDRQVGGREAGRDQPGAGPRAARCSRSPRPTRRRSGRSPRRSKRRAACRR